MAEITDVIRREMSDLIKDSMAGLSLRINKLVLN